MEKNRCRLDTISEDRLFSSFRRFKIRETGERYLFIEQFSGQYFYCRRRPRYDALHEFHCIGKSLIMPAYTHTTFRSRGTRCKQCGPDFRYLDLKSIRQCHHKIFTEPPTKCIKTVAEVTST